jgi:hypothetical protein
VNFVLEIIVSGQRISFFLLSEEIDSSCITTLKNEECTDGISIEIRNGNFYWEDKVLKQLYKDEKERIANKSKPKPKKK